MAPDVIILAAGLGTRMKSSRAKVLHEIGGRSLIGHSVRTALSLGPSRVMVIVGHQASLVEQAVLREVETGRTLTEHSAEIIFVHQAEQRGTGHAVLAAKDYLAASDAAVIVMAGDAPLVRKSTLEALVKVHRGGQNDATVATTIMADPTGYGRIVRGSEGRFAHMVEEKDATPDQRAITEVGVSLYCFESRPLLEALAELRPENAQREYYLTDVPEIMLRNGHRVGIFLHRDVQEVMGVNTRVDLADLEKTLREKKLRELMLGGVTIIDPATTYIHDDVEIGQDTIIHPQVIIEGPSRIGAGCTIQSWTCLRKVTVADEVTVRNSCVIEDAWLEHGAIIGPFARLRMHARIGEEAVIGNFVEVKKSSLGPGTKAQHLSYLGDATIGAAVNIGAGTVTCNFDGTKKHQTVIEDGVKIGSDTMLVAPVTVSHGSVTGAGAVVTRDVPPDSLAVGIPAVVKKKLK